MDDIRQYFSRMAPAFDSYYNEPSHSLIGKIGHEVFRKPGLVRRFQATMDSLQPFTGKRIFDAGCGPGAFSVYMWKQGADVFGMDLAPAMIDAARQHAAEAGWEKPALVSGDVLEHTTTEPYDATIAIGVFDYLGPDVRDEFLRHLRSLTAGPVLATFPKLFTPQSPVRRLYFVGKECPVYFYTAKEVRRLAGAADAEAKFIDCGPIWTIAFA